VVFCVQAEAPPLTEDASGALRVGNSRVLLELVVRAFQEGATSEAIVQQYSTLKLSDVYATIAYYLRHSSETEQCLNSTSIVASSRPRRFASGLNLNREN
jgi:uncharacterized protein (DUF433 family)